LAADGYHASNVTESDGSEFSGLSGRIQPRASLAWRLPLVRPGEVLNQTIEPQASVTVAPNGGNPDTIPNEDSQEIEFDETNLFRDNLYDGIDRVDGGTRFNYGINYLVSTEDYDNGAIFIGQSYRPRVSSSFTQASGQDDNFSDVVATVQMSPKHYIDLLYRTQFSPDNLSPQRNELTTQIGGAPLRLNLDYTFVDQQVGSEFGGREEISGQLSSRFNRNWSGSVSALRDINASEMRSLGMRLVYEDECVRFTTSLARSFFEDRDLKPSDTITFTVVLKTLGEVSTGVSQGQ
jgi:LPS-assembly protein